MSLKKELRDAVFSNSKKHFRSEEFECNGKKFYVKQRSVGENQNIEQTSKTKDGESDNTLYLINSMISMVVDENGEKVFTQADRDSLLGLAADDPFISAFTEAVVKLGKGEDEVGKSED